jgi:hypothetical protein
MRREARRVRSEPPVEEFTDGTAAVARRERLETVQLATCPELEFLGELRATFLVLGKARRVRQCPLASFQRASQ